MAAFGQPFFLVTEITNIANNKKAANARRRFFVWGEENYFFFSRNPAAKMATAARSHSMRHSCTACQSSRVFAVKTKPVTMAAITQAQPRIRAIREALV